MYLKVFNIIFNLFFNILVIIVNVFVWINFVSFFSLKIRCWFRLWLECWKWVNLFGDDKKEKIEK